MQTFFLETPSWSNILFVTVAFQTRKAKQIVGGDDAWARLTKLKILTWAVVPLQTLQVKLHSDHRIRALIERVCWKSWLYVPECDNSNFDCSTCSTTCKLYSHYCTVYRVLENVSVSMAQQVLMQRCYGSCHSDCVSERSHKCDSFVLFKPPLRLFTQRQHQPVVYHCACWPRAIR